MKVNYSTEKSTSNFTNLCIDKFSLLAKFILIAKLFSNHSLDFLNAVKNAEMLVI